MSIAPVSSVPPEQIESAVKPSSAPVQAAERASASAAERGETPISVSRSKQRVSSTSKAPVSYQLQQDVVELHQDPELKGQLIVQYLDKAKNVILQVPSAQELAVERGIAQDIQQAEKLHESNATAAVSEEGKTHGD